MNGKCVCVRGYWRRLSCVYLLFCSNSIIIILNPCIHSLIWYCILVYVRGIYFHIFINNFILMCLFICQCVCVCVRVYVSERGYVTNGAANLKLPWLMIIIIIHIQNKTINKEINVFIFWICIHNIFIFIRLTVYFLYI